MLTVTLLVIAWLAVTLMVIARLAVTLLAVAWLAVALLAVAGRPVIVVRRLLAGEARLVVNTRPGRSASVGRVECGVRPAGSLVIADRCLRPGASGAVHPELIARRGTGRPACGAGPVLSGVCGPAPGGV